MKRIARLMAAALLVLLPAQSAFVSTALATSGEALVYRGGAQGKVIFDGRIHAGKGLNCSACHSGLFATQRAGRITLADHNTDTKCFACHNGTRVFNTCTSCHRNVPNT